MLRLFVLKPKHVLKCYNNIRQNLVVIGDPHPFTLRYWPCVSLEGRGNTTNSFRNVVLGPKFELRASQIRSKNAANSTGAFGVI